MGGSECDLNLIGYQNQAVSNGMAPLIPIDPRKVRNAPPVLLPGRHYC